MKVILYRNAVLALTALAGLGIGCNLSTDPTTIANDTLVYACPIAVGIQTSTLVLTPTEKVTIDTAVADCNVWTTGGITALEKIASPPQVAALVIEALVLYQNQTHAVPASKVAQFKALAKHYGYRLKLK